MAAGLSLDQASEMDDDSAKLMLEAWDIAMSGNDGCDGIRIIFNGSFGG